MTHEHPLVVAILNSNDDTVEMLRAVLEHEGFVVVSAHVDEARRGGLSIQELIREHRADALVYDISLPYAQSYHYFLDLRATLNLRDDQVVLTTTNKRAVEEMVGVSNVIEIMGKPYDLGVLTEAIKRAAQSGRANQSSASESG